MNNFMQLKIRQFIEKKFLFQMTIGNLIIDIYIYKFDQPKSQNI